MSNDELDNNTVADEDFGVQDAGFDEFSKKTGILEVIKTNPMAKVGVVVAVVVLVVGVMMFMGGEKEEDTVSKVAGGENLTEAPGTGEVSKVMNEQIEQKNEEDLMAALEKSESHIPTPTGTQDSRLQVEVDQQSFEDPLMEWRQVQEEVIARNLDETEEVDQSVTVLDTQQQAEELNKLAEAMAQQMSSILTVNDETKNMTYKGLVSYKTAEGEGETGGERAPGDSGSGQESSSDNNFEFQEDTRKEILIPAGEIEYAQTLLEANSDTPGPVMATILTGPLKGSRIIGSFTVQEDYLLLEFTRVVLDSGQDYTISAFALDPETSLPGMATEVNHRYLQRIVIPAAVAFVNGYSQALAETDEEQTTSGDTVTETTEEPDSNEAAMAGITSATDSLTTIIQEDFGDVQPLVKIHAGTPIGIFFAEAVEKQEEDI